MSFSSEISSEFSSTRLVEKPTGKKASPCKGGFFQWCSSPAFFAAFLFASPAAAQLICTNPGTIDGDTLRCQDGTRVRLWGVDAPERHDPAGPASTRALAAIVRNQTLTCQPKGRSYERIVAQCFVGGRDVAGEMVRQGQAVDWPKYSKGAYAR